MCMNIKLFAVLEVNVATRFEQVLDTKFPVLPEKANLNPLWKRFGFQITF